MTLRSHNAVLRQAGDVDSHLRVRVIILLHLWNHNGEPTIPIYHALGMFRVIRAAMHLYPNLKGEDELVNMKYKNRRCQSRCQKYIANVGKSGMSVLARGVDDMSPVVTPKEAAVALV